MTTFEIFISIIPIFIGIGLGYFFTRRGIFTSGMIDGFKKVVVNITLPATLISVFVKIRFQASYLWFIAAVFVSCIAMLYVGRLIARLLHIRSKYFPFLLAGFESGMIGYPIVTMVFGPDFTPNFGLIDIGNVFFVFLVYVPMIVAAGGNTRGAERFKASFNAAVRSPVLWSIVIGVAGSLAGLWRYENTPVFTAIDGVLSFLAAPTAFLIYLVIGSGINLSFKGMRLEIGTSLLKIAVGVVFAVAIHFALMRPLGFGSTLSTVLFMMYTLPAPFIIAVFMKNPSIEDRSFVSNTLSIGSVFGVAAIVIIMLTGL